MAVESFRRVKTGIEDLEKLREVKQSLVSQDAMDRLQQRARIRRQFNAQPLSQPLTSERSLPLSSDDTPYQVSRYDPDSDRWLVYSLTNPSEQFSAQLISSGGIGMGTIVRGYPPNAIEHQRAGRRFAPVEPVVTVQEKELKIKIQIGYTGRK